MEGVWNGSETTADRGVGEGEGGLGGDSGRPDDEECKFIISKGMIKK
jgi:hypothetical protein